MARIEFLYWTQCPSYPAAWERLKKIMSESGRMDEIFRVEVKNFEEAVARSFPGSPTIRIDGTDIDPEGAKDRRVGLSCRIYFDEEGNPGPLPSESLIYEKLTRRKKEGENESGNRGSDQSFSPQKH